MSNELRIPRQRDFPPGRLMLRKEHLVSELTRTAESPETVKPPRPHRRRRWALIALIPAAVIAVAAVRHVLVTSPEDVVESIGCFDAANTQDNTTIGPSDGRDPVEVCKDLWEQGIVSVGSTSPPPLVACAIGSGAVGVFPGDQGTCQELGLSHLPSGYPEAAERFVALREELVQRFHDAPGGCFSEAGARAVVQEELDARGFGGWTVEAARPFSQDEPCAMLGFDTPRKVVLLIPQSSSESGPIG
jgi:hypothetical protein